MKVQNKLCKNCFSRSTISPCLLACFIVISIINYSHAWFFNPSYADAVLTEVTTKVPHISFLHSDSTKRLNKTYDDLDYPWEEEVSTEVINTDIPPRLKEDNYSSPTGICTDCQFSCHSKRLCIEPYLVCDGINDCDDGSDELSCPYSKSMADPGCVDDACHRSRENGLNQCGCARTSFNDPTCIKRKEPFLVFSTLNNLYSADLPETSSNKQINKTIERDLGAISAFDYKPFNDLIICLDPFGNKIFTGKVNFEQRYFKAIYGLKVVVDGQHKIHGFVFDWLNYVLIWIDDYGIRSDMIDPTLFSPLNKTKLYRTLDPSYDKPGSIGIDVNKQSIFWLNRGADPMRPSSFPVYVQRIDIRRNETKIETIVNTDIWRPIGLAVDTENAKVYWIDSSSYTVNSVDYDGSNRRTFQLTFTSFTLPFAMNIDEVISMDIFSNYLYFTDKVNSAIQRIDLSNERIDKLISVVDWTPLCVKIIDPIRQNTETPFFPELLWYTDRFNNPGQSSKYQPPL